MKVIKTTTIPSNTIIENKIPIKKNIGTAPLIPPLVKNKLGNKIKLIVKDKKVVPISYFFVIVTASIKAKIRTEQIVEVTQVYRSKPEAIAIIMAMTEIIKVPVPTVLNILIRIFKYSLFRSRNFLTIVQPPFRKIKNPVTRICN